MAAFAALVLLVCVSRVSAQPTPPPPPPGQPELISNRPGFCPERPNVNGSRSCVTEANCTNTQKCCRFPTGLMCAEAVITDYSAAFYVSGIPAGEEATRLLHDAIRAAIGPAASDLIIEIFNEGACAQVHVEVKLNGSASTADAAIHKIEENGISIPSLNQSPFTVSSTDEACPVLYNYETHFFIIGIDYESLHRTTLQAFIESVIGNTVDEWDIEVDQSGPCAEVYLYASANATQEVALSARLAGLETRGLVNITFPVVGTRALNFTSKTPPACKPPPNTTESPYSNECGEGRAMCRGVKKCYALSQMCDGRNDCGDGSDEENCKTSTADCTNSRDYCKNGGRCEYSEYYGETRCLCPAPFSGDQCEIDVCSQMGTSVCSGQGKCIGNLYMDQICNCSTGYKGVFCQEAGTENLTDCQRQRRFNMFLLNALRNGNASVPAAFLNGKTVRQQLMDFDYHTIEMPKCWEDAQRLGKYHSVCSYNVSYMSQVPECVCTNGEGLENGWDYVDGDCKDRPSNVSTNRQGDCPRWTKEAEMGVAVYQCTYDIDCKTDLRAKCCKVGAGSQCVAPVYGDSQFNISVTISGSWDDAFTNRNSSQFRELANVLRTIFGGSSMLRGFRGFDIKEIRSGSIMLTVQLTGAADLGYNDIMALLEDLKSQRIQLGSNIRTITNTAHVAAGACAGMNCGPGVCLNGTGRVMCVCPDTHMGMQCEKQDPCLQTVCMNGGTCNSRPDTAAMSFEFFCQCPMGFAGRACEVSVCDTFSVTGRVCGQQGTCVGDLFTGHLCSCLADRTGTFCETAGKESLTDCQRKARLSEHAQALFQQGKSLPSGGLTAAGLKELLLAMRIEWLPLYKCEQDGSFTLAINRLSVLDMRTTERMCVSVEGVEEQGCNSKVCQSLGMYGICQNGGQCVGDIYGQLCDCTSTQHHGAICTEPGEQTGTPECMRRQDLANLTLRVLNGTGMIGSFPAVLVSGLLRQLMSEIGLTEIWMPRCTVDGEYTRVGCEYNVSNILTRECFCVDGNQQRDPNARLPDCLPVVMPPVEPGCNCSVGEKCLQGLRPGVFACSCDPEEDGECRQPQWYCGGMANCSLGEKCVHKKVCDDRQNCQPIRSYCVPMNTPDICDRQPCKHGGSCVAADENIAGFVCQCPAEFGGKFCEINLNVCSVVPSALCDRCIGDLMMGILCECPLGRAGLECQHPANTKCERQRALYTDVMGIVKGTYPVHGYSVEEARRFVRAVMATIEANFLPMPNCTADGSFAPVQCDMTLGMMVKQCHCVNVNGHPLSSNVMAYPGYPPCTAPFSPNLTAELLCGSMGSLCQNGGRCVGNLLNSTMCQCPSTHTGIFCQNVLEDGEKPDEPMTLCELALEVYDLMRGMASGSDQARSQMPYLQAIRSVLFPAGNLPDVMIKAKCNNDGQFDQVQCTYNITTDRPLHCYCMGPKGILMNTMTNVTVRPRCDDVPKCPTFASCTLKCEHGLTLDMQGCEICRCRDPCEGLCGRDPAVRCVVERREDCKRPDWDGPCTAGVCRLRKKPGMCPVSIAANLTSLTTMQNMTASSCDVQCLDDADCPSDHKCCGLCGTKCVPPFEEKGCQSMKESAQQHVAILQQLHQTIVETGVNLDTLPAFIRMQLEIAEDMNAVWVPECDAEGFFMPRQCMTVISNKTDIANGDTDMEGGMMDDEDMMDDLDETSMEEMERKMQKFGGCFCVDRFGQHIKGTEGDSADEVTCEVKPGECPFLQPNGTMDHDCDGDFNCQGPLKCCSDGLDATMCVLPAFALRPAEVASIDETMIKICDLVPDICGANSTCVRNWETDGRICACRQNMYGSLCTSSDRPAAQLTPCQERQVMVDLLMQGPPFLLEKIERLIYTTSNATKTVVLQYTSCDKEGRFEPMQCEINTDGEMQACYCVNKEGRRLPGTTAPPEEAKKMKCAAVNPCDVGTPLHHLNGSLVKCMHGLGVCAPDYHCEAGYFGELFCCRDRFSKVDECDIPANPGFDCPYYTDNSNNQDHKDDAGDESASPNEDRDMPKGQGNGQPPVMDDAVKKEIMEQRFVFNSRTRQCEAFEYKGCSNARMNFNNKPSCEARCLRKEHLGQCPTFEVPVRSVCTDSCRSDADCEEDQKCCASSCGRRCVRALNEEGAQCEIGQPLVDTSTNQQAVCSSSRPCPAGYMCNKGMCCPQRQVEVCKQPVQSGPCYAYFTRYFFNSTSMRCEQFVYGGCNGNDNNFETMEECCNTCAKRGKCKEGTCPKIKPVLTSSCKSRCQSDGDCPRNQICCASGCGGFSCVIPRSEKDEEYMCNQRLQGYHQQRRLAGDANCFLKYMPRCAEDGSWQEQQCSDKLGICWCVTRHGNEIAGTRTFGVAQCQFATNAERQSADRDVEKKKGGDSEQCEVCPNGQPVQCCPQELCLQVCAADPTAVCRINPCGGCKAQFFNAKNETVNCTAGLTKCQRERMTASLARHQHAIVAVAASQDTKPMMTDMRGTSSASDYQVSYVQGGVPLMCHLRASSGNCKAYMPQWFYNVTSQKCEVFLYGMCGGNENQFNSPAECYERCNSVKSPCAVVRCGTGPCQLTYDTDCFHGPCNVQPKCAPEPRSGHKMLGVYVPECTRNGTFAYRQCQNGFCWCVNANGEYSSGFTNEADSPTCDEKGPVGPFSLPTCPDGLSRPNPNCVNRCRDAVCPGKPFARCVVNLCSNDCSTSFVDLAGSAVQCTADDQEETCKAHIFDKSQASCPSKASCSGKSPLTCGQEDICDDVVCKNNPCAICITDPCSGQVYFKDRLNGRRYNLDQCDKLVHKSCELRTCEVMAQNDLARDNDTMLAMPTCEPDGSYRAHQKLEDNVDVCVDSFGEFVEVLDPSKGCKKDPLVKVKFSLKYNGNFDQVARGKEDKIRDAFLRNVEKFGITPQMVLSFAVRPGSIIVDAVIGQAKNMSAEFDLAAITPLIQQQAAAGQMDMTIDGQTLMMATDNSAVQFEAVTASQVQPRDEPSTTPVPGTDADGAGLSTGGKIAIAVVFSVLGVVLLALLAYCCCCKKRRGKQADYIDSTYDKPAETHPPKGTSMAVTNNTYDMYDNLKPTTGGPATNKGFQADDNVDDDHYVQVRM